MCKLGDIIVVNNYIGDDGKIITKHSFVVINDKPGFIQGLGYDFVANVMSSFKNEEHRMKKLRFEENIEIISKDIISDISTNRKSGFIKADQLIYFDKKKIDYYILGRIDNELLDDLMLLIKYLNNKGKLKMNVANIKEVQNQ